MNSCRTCKHWVPPAIDDEGSRGLCHGLEDKEDFLSDRDDYVETGPDFGCIHHETK